MKTVLIVDDKPEMREVLNLILNNRYNIIEASSGHEAASIAETHDLDLVITDLQMPDGDGFWLLKHLQEQIGKVIPVIVVSGHSTISTAEVLRAGAVAFFKKPFDMAAVQTVVHDLLGT